MLRATRGSGCDPHDMETREDIVVYDYGTGGVWPVILAPFRSVLESAYPELVVFEERPAWMDQDEYERILVRSGFDSDEPDDYWWRFYQRA